MGQNEDEMQEKPEAENLSRSDALSKTEHAKETDYLNGSEEEAGTFEMSRPENPEQSLHEYFGNEVRLYDTENYVNPAGKGLVAIGKDNSINWKIVILIAVAVVLLLVISRILYGGVAQSELDFFYPVGTDYSRIEADLVKSGITYRSGRVSGDKCIVVSQRVRHNLLGETGMQMIYVFDRYGKVETERIVAQYSNYEFNESQIMRFYRNSTATLKRTFGKPRYSDVIAPNDDDPILQRLKDALQGNAEDPMYLSIWKTVDGEISVCRYMNQIVVTIGPEEVYLSYLEENHKL